MKAKVQSLSIKTSFKIDLNRNCLKRKNKTKIKSRKQHYNISSLQVSLCDSYSSIPTRDVCSEAQPEREKRVFKQVYEEEFPPPSLNINSHCTELLSPCSCTRMQVPSCTALFQAACELPGRLPFSVTHAQSSTQLGYCIQKYVLGLQDQARSYVTEQLKCFQLQGGR